MNNLPAVHFPLGARGNNFDNQIKIIYSWSKRIPFTSSGPFCAWSMTINSLHLCIIPTIHNRSLPLSLSLQDQQPRATAYLGPAAATAGLWHTGHEPATASTARPAGDLRDAPGAECPLDQPAAPGATDGSLRQRHTHARCYHASAPAAAR